MTNGSQVDLDRLRQHMAANAEESGRRVRARRVALGLTQAQLAGMIGDGFPITTISKIELGEIVARDYLRAALAVRLACEISDLFPWPTRKELTRVA